MRFPRLPAVAVLFGAVVVACTGANPGWTYTPAPPVTPAPSVVEIAPPSAGASGGADASGEPGSGDVTISALNVAFEQTSVTAPAGEGFQIAFDNKDAGVPHNVAIHRDSATGAEVFKGELITGPATATYDVPALDAGTYTFVCTVHPNMTGNLTAE